MSCLQTEILSGTRCCEELEGRDIRLRCEDALADGTANAAVLEWCQIVVALTYSVDGEMYSACHYDDFRGRHDAW